MKKIILLIATPLVANHPPVNLTVKVDFQNNLIVKSEASQYSMQQSEQQAKQVTQTVVPQPIVKRKKSTSSFSNVGTLLKAAPVVVFCAYLYSWYQTTKSSSSLLTSPLLWSLWKKNMSTQELKEIPLEQLEAELMIDIQQRYKKTNLIDALKTFDKHINKEIKKITGVKRHKPLLPFLAPKENKQALQDKLEKLTYLKSIFDGLLRTRTVNQQLLTVTRKPRHTA